MVHRRLLKSFLIGVLFFHGFQVFAAGGSHGTGLTESEIRKTLRAIQEKYRAAGDLQADFEQTYFDQLSLGKPRRESGKLWSKPDGRVRWSYLSPERKDFVFDGKTAFFYEPENAQVTLFEHFADSSVAHVLRFVWGQGAVNNSFRVTACSGQCPSFDATKERLIELVPLESIPTVQRIILVVDVGDVLLRRSILDDPLGNRTEYAFRNVVMGRVIDPKKFLFVPPEGISVLRADVGAGPSSGTSNR